MAIMQIVISPRGAPGVSLSPYIARAIRVLQASGLPHEEHSMGTNVEGSTAELLKLAAEMHEATFGDDLSRVVLELKIDDRRDKVVALGDKQRSLQSKV